ncbi:MAG: hypothetical protein JSS76_13715, partial [Bacteroidetes bacterium]|nr:hypothetical protein [Bacteroidota bacterium]
ICSVKGVSINYFLKDFEDKILAKYRTTFSINPKKGAFYLKFKLSVKEGRVKHMPESGDDSHYNLLKADSFNLANLEIIDTVKFA